MPAFASIASLASVGGSLYSGFAANQAATQEAALQKSQGDIALKEANINATNEAYNETQLVGRQQVAFLANGVSLEGSPSLVLAQSKAYGQQQVDAILQQGQARYSLAQEGADITVAKGRAALVSGGMNALGGLSRLGAAAYKSGMLDSNGNPIK